MDMPTKGQSSMPRNGKGPRVAQGKALPGLAEAAEKAEGTQRLGSC